MKMLKKSNKICVLGAGLWGTVLANRMARDHKQVWLWEFFQRLARNLEEHRKHPHIPQLELSPHVRVTADILAAAAEAEVVLVALPSTVIRPTMRKLRGIASHHAHKPWIVSASKCLEPGTLMTVCEVIEEEAPGLAGRVYALSGPSFAREVARGVATKLLLAGPLRVAAHRLRETLEGPALRVALCADRKGVELGGAIKNVLAIGCGLLDGMKAGANTKAAMITQGVAEMGTLIRARGGKAATIYGLAGLGDLIATGTSPESRNRGLGERLGAGATLQQALKAISTVAEGVESAESAHELVAAARVDAPLLEAIWKVVHGGAQPGLVMQAMGFD